MQQRWACGDEGNLLLTRLISRTLEEPLCSVPELCFDVTGTGGAVLHLLLLLLPQDALGQQVVGGCDVVVLVGLQRSERTVTPSGRKGQVALQLLTEPEPLGESSDPLG